MAFIELEDVVFSYPNGVTAVDGVSFSVEEGESVAIVGQNGAGKTTTVKMINGLLRPSSGRAVVNGIATTDRTAAATARDVGYVFQNPDDQIFNSTAFAEIEYGLKRQKIDADAARQRVEAAAEICGIRADLETNPYDLPLSIRKFVTIASVIAADTKVVILDEPTAGQDLVGLNRIAGIIGHLQQQGKIVITITHDMEFVAEHFQRVIVMANKRVVVDDLQGSVFRNPDVMREARLTPPVIAQALDRLGLDDVPLHVEEIAKRLAG
ncbi:energy-coupling factor ABC transporter ATP-binding protein [Agrococcus sp. HG114]|uniref:energy-coupling factor ABC transporter ATP-binding protein n=1 Tax=Agrococcus sp. HG114 TaxID=2969757 RepID=UPI00215A54F0|nr:ABC transporter ATP-binding protein [Agrococcus sp. HG114]MCR8669771.1 energy-coupling factor ABC transporter ATP-binding protein [Agrococcus sp. HG114]